MSESNNNDGNLVKKYENVVIENNIQNVIEPPTIKLGVTPMTTILLDKIRKEMSSVIGYEITIEECIAFIIEDYTKSFYAKLTNVG